MTARSLLGKTEPVEGGRKERRMQGVSGKHRNCLWTGRGAGDNAS